MIIWSGHGILVPVIAVLGFYAGTFGVATFAKQSPQWSLAAGLWTAGVLVYIYSRTIGRTTSHPHYDRDVREHVTLRKRHSFLFIPAKCWSVLVMLAAALVTAGTLFIPKDAVALFTDIDTPGEKAFLAAHMQIISPAMGTGTGNTVAATSAAQDFSAKLKGLREAGLGASKSKKDPFNQGEFITFCQASGNSCAFIVNVPDLRNYSKEAGDFIADAAWKVAQECAATLESKPLHLAVGIRGVFLYDRVITGTLNSKNVIKLEHPSADARKTLVTYFLSANDAASNTVAAGSGASPSGVDGAIAADTTQPLVPTAVRECKSADGRSFRGSLEGFSDPSGETGLFKREDTGLIYPIVVTKFTPEVQAELRDISLKLR